MIDPATHAAQRRALTIAPGPSEPRAKKRPPSRACASGCRKTFPGGSQVVRGASGGWVLADCARPVAAPTTPRPLHASPAEILEVLAQARAVAARAKGRLPEAKPLPLPPADAPPPPPSHHDRDQGDPDDRP